MRWRISNVTSRIETARMMLDLMRWASETYLRDRRFGARAGDLLLCAAIFVSQAEGRPVGSARLAHAVGMPRTTVLRRLSALEEANLVTRESGRYILTQDKLNSFEAISNSRRERARIIRTAKKMSNLDT